MAAVLHNQNCMGSHSTGFAGKGSSMAEEEDSPAEDLAQPKAEVVRLLVQTEGAIELTEHFRAA